MATVRSSAKGTPFPGGHKTTLHNTIKHSNKKMVPEMGDDYDAFEAMLNRGAFLRKLREMELADELERAANAAEEEGSNNTNSDTLDYVKGYLENQRYWDDLKHINYRFIDFGDVGTINQADKENCSQQQQSSRVLIEQDRGFGKGGYVWDAGYILGEHLILEQSQWKPIVQRETDFGKPISIVELGAGTGISGLMVAAAMPGEVQVALTDLPELMPLLEKNLAHNPSCTNATAFPLPWGSGVEANYDLVIAADVVAGIYCPDKLAKTIWDLCHENTLVCITINLRLHEAVATFQEAMGKLFDCVEDRPAISRNKNPNVSVLIATNKKR